MRFYSRVILLLHVVLWGNSISEQIVFGKNKLYVMKKSRNGKQEKQIAWNKIFIINKSFLINVIHVQKYGLLIRSRLLLSYFCSILYFVSRFPYLSSASLFLNVFTIIWFQFQNTVRSDFLHNFSNAFTLPLHPLLKLIRASKLETSVFSYQKRRSWLSNQGRWSLNEVCFCPVSSFLCYRLRVRIYFLSLHVPFLIFYCFCDFLLHYQILQCESV